MYQFQKFPATVSCKMFFEKKNCMRKEKKDQKISLDFLQVTISLSVGTK